jgi:hypothetical protein
MRAEEEKDKNEGTPGDQNIRKRSDRASGKESRSVGKRGSEHGKKKVKI